MKMKKKWTGLLVALSALTLTVTRTAFALQKGRKLPSASR